MPVLYFRQGQWQRYKLSTILIYHNSMVIPSLFVIKLHYLGNYHGMAVNHRGKKYYNIGPMVPSLHSRVIYNKILTLENVSTVVNYCDIVE